MTAGKLSERNCEPCRGGVPALEGEELRRYADQVTGWQVVDEHHLARTFKFPDFRSALAFVNAVGEIAEREQHHPDIYLAWGRVEVKTWTHKADGLTANDFILAAKVDQEFSNRQLRA